MVKWVHPAIGDYAIAFDVAIRAGTPAPKFDWSKLGLVGYGVPIQKLPAERTGQEQATPVSHQSVSAETIGHVEALESSPTIKRAPGPCWNCQANSLSYCSMCGLQQ